MERGRISSMGLALALALATGCATAPGAPGAPDMAVAANAAQAALQAGDYETADRAWSGILVDPRFAAMPDDRRAAMLADAANAATSVGDHDRARDLMLRSVSLAPSDVDAWWGLTVVELRRGDHEAAANALARIALTDPGALDNIDAQLIGFVVGESDPAGLPHLDLLQALFDAGWSHQGLGVDYLWVDLALLRVERGEHGIAARVIERIRDPNAIVRLRMDKRFDALVDRDDPRFDVAAAVQHKLAHLRALSASAPRWLEARNYLGFALLEAGDATAALADTDAILAAVEASTGEDPFDDMGELSWVGNTRAIALRRLGRLDEAASALREASLLGEDGVPNVSQVLNLGVLLCGLGRWEEALDTITDVGEMSGYGRMVEAKVEHCAALGLGNQPAADAALAYIRAHREDAEPILLEALLEAGRVDEAATLVVGQLQSPRARDDVLLSMQEFREAPPLPANLAFEAAWEAMLGRPDVQAAITAVGRIETHPIHADAGF